MRGNPSIKSIFHFYSKTFVYKTSICGSEIKQRSMSESLSPRFIVAFGFLVAIQRYVASSLDTLLMLGLNFFLSPHSSLPELYLTWITIMMIMAQTVFIKG